MKNLLSVVFVLLLATLAGGCAKNSNHLSKYAIPDPAEAISRPHPTMMQVEKIEKVTLFRGIINPGLWVEIIKGNGNFPAIAIVGEKEYLGYAYLVENNHWGKPILQYEFKASHKELEKAKFVLLNRDGSYAAYNLQGELVGRDKNFPGEKAAEYDAKKFDDDTVYRSNFVSEHGSTLASLDNFWRQYYRGKIMRGIVLTGDEFDSYITEYTVGSESWVAMVKSVVGEIDSGKLTDYKVGNVTRIAKMNFEEFADKGSDVHDATTGNRIIKRAMIPVITLASLAAGPLAMAGASFAGTVYSANVDNDWHIHTMKSKFWGHELAQTIIYISKSFEKIIEGRDKELMPYARQQNQLSRK